MKPATYMVFHSWRPRNRRVRARMDYADSYGSGGLEEMMDVGLIGLGRMGTGIAKSLLHAGHRVTVYNRTRERAEALRKDGAAVAGRVAEGCRGEAVPAKLAADRGG